MTNFGYNTDATRLTSRIKYQIAYPYAFGRYAEGKSVDGFGWYGETIDEDEKNHRLIELAHKENTSIQAINKIYREQYQKASMQAVRIAFGVTFYDELPYSLMEEQFIRQAAKRYRLSEKMIEESYTNPDMLWELDEEIRDIQWAQAD